MAIIFEILLCDGMVVEMISQYLTKMQTHSKNRSRSAKNLLSLSIILSLCMPLNSIAQLDRQLIEIDMGNIKQKNEDVLDLIIKNPEDQAVYLLNYKVERPVQFRSRSPFIPPNGAEVFRIKINPSQEGEFESRVQMYFSNSEEPFIVILKGDVKQISVNDLQKCPSFKDLPSSREIARRQRRAAGNVQERVLSLNDFDQAEIESTVEPKAQLALEDSLPEVDSSAFRKITPVNELLGDEYLPNNIIFLIDASSSMEDEARFDLLKISLIELLKPLRSIDYLSMISYAGEAELLLAPTSSVEKDSIGKVIRSLKASGSTNAVKGIDLALETAYDSFIEGGNNEIYLVTDGAFSLGSRNRRSRNDLDEAADYGIKVSVLAVKSDRIARKSLREISKLGDGDLIRIEREGDKDKVLKAIKRSSLR